jgi:hypothetical protein
VLRHACYKNNSCVAATRKRRSYWEPTPAIRYPCHSRDSIRRSKINSVRMPLLATRRSALQSIRTLLAVKGLLALSGKQCWARHPIAHSSTTSSGTQSPCTLPRQLDYCCPSTSSNASGYSLSGSAMRIDFLPISKSSMRFPTSSARQPRAKRGGSSSPKCLNSSR